VQPRDLSPWIPKNPDFELVAIGAQVCSRSLVNNSSYLVVRVTSNLILFGHKYVDLFRKESWILKDGWDVYGFRIAHANLILFLSTE
jgi:hypothetical protein